MNVYAVLVGINAYPAPNQLQGCLADVDHYSDLLMTKYPNIQLTVLRDADATRQAVKDALYAVAATVKPGDLLLDVESGHGAELDNGVHTACNVDFSFYDPSTWWTPSDVSALLATIKPGVHFRMAYDRCFSGPMMGKGFRPSIKYMNRNIPNPHGRPYAIRTFGQRFRDVLEPGAYIPGCGSEQTCADESPERGGAFSYRFIPHLQSDLGANAVTLAAKTCQDLAADGFDQRPEAHGAQAQEAFLL